jgi:hypothetical protein
MLPSPGCDVVFVYCLSLLGGGWEGHPGNFHLTFLTIIALISQAKYQCEGLSAAKYSHSMTHARIREMTTKLGTGPTGLTEMDLGKDSI